MPAYNHSDIINRMGVHFGVLEGFRDYHSGEIISGELDKSGHLWLHVESGSYPSYVGDVVEDKIVLLPQYFEKVIHLSSRDRRGNIRDMKDYLRRSRVLLDEIPNDLLTLLLDKQYGNHLGFIETVCSDGRTIYDLYQTHPFVERVKKIIIKRKISDNVDKLATDSAVAKITGMDLFDVEVDKL